MEYSIIFVYSLPKLGARYSDYAIKKNIFCEIKGYFLLKHRCPVNIWEIPRFARKDKGFEEMAVKGAGVGGATLRPLQPPSPKYIINCFISSFIPMITGMKREISMLIFAFPDNSDNKKEISSLIKISFLFPMDLRTF